jgi:hypothetical protein
MKSKTTKQKQKSKKKKKKETNAAFLIPQSKNKKTKHLQPLILPHNKTPIETNTHTKGLQTKYSKGRIQIAQILDTR